MRRRSERRLYDVRRIERWFVYADDEHQAERLAQFEGEPALAEVVWHTQLAEDLPGGAVPLNQEDDTHGEG